MIAAIVAEQAASTEALRALFPAGATAFKPEIKVNAGPGLSWATAHRPDGGGAGAISGYRDPRSGRVALVYGRLFNLRELAPGLSGEDAAARAVLQLFESGDPDWESRLRGQFAIVIWDPATHKAIAVRDRFGIMSLYYRSTKDGIAFASAAKQLLNIDGVKSEPDRQMIGSYLTDDILRNDAFSTERTFFADVKRVVSGHSLVANGHGATQKPYWDVSALFRAPKNENPDPAKYLDLFGGVVREQAGSFEGIGSALSGGLDSPAILVLLGKCDPERKIPTVSLGELGEGVSESSNIKAVLDGVNTQPTWVSPDDYDMFNVISDSHWFQECPAFSPSPAVFYLLKQAAAEHGISTLFSGLGADELLGGLNLGYLADLFWQGRWMRFAREMSAYQKVDSLRLRLSAVDLFRNQVFDPVKLIRSRRPVPSWIRPELIDEFDLDQRHWHWPQREGLSEFDTRVCTLLTQTFTPCFLQYETHNALAWGIENRFPYIDDQMVAYSARLPWHERSADGIYKIHHREAMKSLVPPQVWKQTKKTLIPTVHDQWLRVAYKSQVDAIINDGGRWTEYLDAAKVREEHARYQATEDFTARNQLRRSTWRAVSLGLFLDRFWN